MRSLVYLAGPYTKPTPTYNVAEAVKWADTLENLARVAVVVPHLSILWDMLSPRPYEDWLAYDLEIIRRCDALYRMPGESFGADAEVAFAESIGVPVFDTLAAVTNWELNRQARVS